MSHVTHANAKLTPAGRLQLILLVVEGGWAQSRVSEPFQYRWGPDLIGKPIRSERTAPVDLVHVDVKKLGRIPDGGGHRPLAAEGASALNYNSDQARADTYPGLRTTATCHRPHTGIGGKSPSNVFITSVGRTSRLEAWPTLPKTCP
ncbi:hypothetical protein HNR05_002401 [Leifsonia psychrotolerans]|uniref:Uncharacterized protein n=1 Tax=Glaciibacter psychrotolerans TaxID=670054 RepID=A0A7Z0EFK5_9MICO|nr:hypothetical protein [Leifsonia psychrotolerans]